MSTPNPPPPPPAPPKAFPYDHLFKLLMIGDAGVGKVSFRNRAKLQTTREFNSLDDIF